MKKCVFLLLAIFFLAACGRGGGDDLPEDGPILPVQGGTTQGGATQGGATQNEALVLPPREAAPITLPVPPVHPGGASIMQYELVIPLIHDYVSAFRYGVARIYALRGLEWRFFSPVGMIDTQGELVFSPETDVLNIGEVYNSITWFILTRSQPLNLGSKTVIVDVNSGLVLYELPPWSMFSDFVRGYDMMVVERFNIDTNDRAFGVMTISGQEIAPLDYRRLVGFNEGVGIIVVSPEDSPHLNRVGFVDLGGNFIIEPRFHDARPFAHGVAAVSSTRMADGPRWGLIDLNGEEVLPERYQHIGPFSGGLARVQRAGNQGFINSLGEMVIPVQNMMARNFSEGMVAFAHFYIIESEMFWLWGFMDAEGMPRVSPQFYQVRDFSGGMAAVAVRGDDGELLWGFVNTLGEMVIPPMYDWVSCFIDGYAVVNRHGETFSWTEFDDDFLFIGSRAITGAEMRTVWQVTGGDFYIVDTLGRMVLQLPDFCAVGEMSEGMLPVNQGRTMGGPEGNRQVVEEGRWGFVRLVK